jgi:hypothetical protein
MWLLVQPKILHPKIGLSTTPLNRSIQWHSLHRYSTYIQYIPDTEPNAIKWTAIPRVYRIAGTIEHLD